MKNRRRFLAEPAIQFALALAIGLLLGWPIVQVAAMRGLAVLFIYVFVLWGLAIALIAVVAGYIRADTARKGPDRETP